MSDLRTAAQQALEALIKGCNINATEWHQAIYALRSALARQAEPVPVAWSGYDLDGMVEAFSRVIEAHHSSKHPFHNPIDMDARMALRILRGFIPAMKAYAALAQEQAEPVERAMQDAVTTGMGIMRGGERIDPGTIYKPIEGVPV